MAVVRVTKTETPIRSTESNTPVRLGPGNDAFTFRGKALDPATLVGGDMWQYNATTDTWVLTQAADLVGVVSTAGDTMTGLLTLEAGLAVGVVSEVVADAGVLIDGLLIKNGGIPAAAVTAHEAALLITQSQITDLSSTSDLAEGTNLYHTSERVDDRVAALIQDGTGISWAYDDVLNTFTPTVSLTPFSTSDLSEGTGLFFTDERVDDRVAVLLQTGGGLSWAYDDVANTLTPVLALTNVDIDAGAAIVASKIAAGTFGAGAYAFPDTLDIEGAKLTINSPVTSGDVTTGGIVINQTGPGGALALKLPSGVSHTMTGIAEADTYGLIQPAQGGSGGFTITGLKDNTNSAGLALWLRGFIVGSTEISKLTSSIGNIVLDAAKGSGVGVGALSSNANMVVMRDNQTAKFIFSSDAEMHTLGAGGTSVYGESLKLFGDMVSVGNTTNTSISGGDTVSSGGNLQMFGGAHPSVASDIRLRAGTTNRLAWDQSAGKWTMTGDFDVTGLTTLAAFTSTGPITANAGITLADSQILRWTSDTILARVSAGIMALTGGMTISTTLRVDSDSTFNSLVTITEDAGDTVVLNKDTGPNLQFNKTNATAQTWSLAGEGSAFILRDVTRASATVFSWSNTAGLLTAPGVGTHSFGASSGDSRIQVKSSAPFGFRAENALAAAVHFGALTGATPSAVISNNAGTALLTLTNAGNATIAGTTTSTGLITATAGVRAGNGTAAAPGYNFVSDPDSGLFRSGTNEISLSTNGTRSWLVDATQRFRMIDGAAATPAYAFINDANTGMYRVSADVLAFATAGVERLTVSAAGLTATIGSFGTTPALEGAVRIPNAVANGIYARNAANTNSIPLIHLDTANAVVLGESGIPVVVPDTLTVTGASTLTGNVAIGSASAGSGDTLSIDAGGSVGVRAGIIHMRGATGDSIVQINVIGDTFEIGGGGTMDTSPSFTVDVGSGVVIVPGTFAVTGVATLSNQLAFDGNTGTVPASISKGATNGLAIRGVTGSANDFILQNNGGGTVFRVPTGTTNIAFNGNLDFSTLGLLQMRGGTTGVSWTNNANTATLMRLDDGGAFTVFGVAGFGGANSGFAQVTIHNVGDFLEFFDTNGVAGQRRWKWVTAGSLLKLRGINDSGAQIGADFSYDATTGDIGVGGALTATGLITATAGTFTERATPGASTFRAKVVGDSFDRFQVLANGELQWGGGLGARDVLLTRGVANRLDLAAGDSFNIVSGDLTVGGQLVATGLGPHAIGGLTSASIGLSFAPSVTSVNAIGFSGRSVLTAAAGPVAYHMALRDAGSITLTGVVTNVATLNINEPNIALAGGAATNATSLRIAGAPTEGTFNRAFWVEGGLSEVQDLKIIGNLGLFGQAATAQPTGVAVDAASIHAALVTLNVFTA